MEYYLAIERKETGSLVETWMDPESHTERRKAEREDQVSYVNIYVLDLETHYRRTHMQDRNNDADEEDTAGEERMG